MCGIETMNMSHTSFNSIFLLTSYPYTQILLEFYYSAGKKKRGSIGAVNEQSENQVTLSVFLITRLNNYN